MICILSIKIKRKDCHLKDICFKHFSNNDDGFAMRPPHIMRKLNRL